MPKESTYTEFDKAYLDVDRHGMPGGWSNPDQKKFQTDNDKIIQFCKDIVDADDISPIGYNELMKLREAQLKKIIELRHRKIALKIKNNDTTDLEKQIYLDLEIIAKAIRTKNLFDNDINVSYLVGENKQNIVGVLSSYEILIIGSTINHKNEILEIIKELKNNIIKSKQIGYDDGGRKK